MDGHYRQCQFPFTGDKKDCCCEIGRYKRAVAITAGILFIQAITVWYTNNLALRADTFHVLSDLFVNIGSLVISGICLKISDKAEKLARVFFASAGILLLLGGGVHVLIEAYDRIMNPALITVWPVIFVAAIGAGGNYWVHAILKKTPAEDRNTTHGTLSAHVLADLACSLGVILSAVFIFFSGWTKADPYMSIGIAGYIFFLSGRLSARVLERNERRGLLSFFLICASLGLLVFAWGAISIYILTFVIGILIFFAGFCFGSKHHKGCCH